MHEKSDARLLRDYARHGDETAFAELVRRHTNLVYSAAARQVDSPDIAAEVAQSVFISLARGAQSLSPRLTEDASLAGWLCRSARNISLNLRRDEFRRHSRERQAMEHLDTNFENAPDWERLRFVLDEAMSELDENDYDALVMRFFNNQDLRTVGMALGVSDDTAQKRVSRALDKLREHLSGRGIRTTAAALSVVLTANAVQAAPIGLAVTISTATVTGTTVATATTTLTKTIVMTTLQKTLITAAVVASVATTLLIQHRDQVRLREENESLRQQVVQLRTNFSRQTKPTKRMSALHRPAPRVRTVTPAETTENSMPTNLIARLLRGDEAPNLTTEQVATYLDENRRSAASLLAAYRATGDVTLLEEAMQKYPGDPQVAFEAVFKKGVPPEQQREWLDAFKKSAPENPLANYLSALDYFKSGQTDQAVTELEAANAKQKFHDYTLDRIQGDEEAYRTAGYSVSEAKIVSAHTLLLPQLAQLRDLGLNMVELANSYRQAGDEASAQAALQMAVNMGQHFDGLSGSAGLPLVTQLVGLSIERNALKAMNPASSYGDGGETVQDRINQLEQQKAAINNIAKQTEALFPKMSDQDWISYKDRERAFGEESAAQWLINKHGPKQ